MSKLKNFTNWKNIKRYGETNDVTFSHGKQKARNEMANYRNIPQSIKDNVLHYINQVYDEAYELGYQHGKRQGESDIEKTQRMIEDAVQSLKELTINQTNKSDDIP